MDQRRELDDHVAAQLMTVDVVNGIRPLAAADYAADFSGGPTSNVKIAASINNDATVDINALVVGTGTTNITGTGTIRPASGAVVLATSGVVSNNIDFGTAEGIIHVGAIAAIDGVISGSNGLTKAGDFALNTAAAHTYTGPTTINAGGFRFTNPDAFDTTSGFVVRSIGGQELVPTLDYRGTGTVTIDKPAVVESGVMRLANGTPLAPSSAMVYSGVISGPGQRVPRTGRDHADREQHVHRHHAHQPRGSRAVQRFQLRRTATSSRSPARSVAASC